MMAPILKDLKLALQDDIKIIKIDVDKNNAAAAQFQIAGVPTLILFKNGQLVWRQSGAMPLSAIKTIIEKHR
jgi:thioredoxin 1